MQFIDAVNRVLRINGLIRGDTDPLATFSDTAHNSSSQLAQIAVQREITTLSARQLLPSTKTTQATITLATNTRNYAFPAAFIALWGDPPFFYDATQNVEIYEHPGGENRLRTLIYNYRTQYGYPMWFYFDEGGTQQVSFFPVPDSRRNGTVFTYDYVGSVNVSAYDDTIPFTTTEQQYAFVDMAARRFKYLYEGKLDQPIERDPVWMESFATLLSLTRNKKPASRYGSAYV